MLLNIFPLGNCELVVAFKHKQNQKHCGLPLKLVFLPQCEAILPINKNFKKRKKITPSVKLIQSKGARQGICANKENHQIPTISTYCSFEVVSPPTPTSQLLKVAACIYTLH